MLDAIVQSSLVRMSLVKWLGQAWQGSLAPSGTIALAHARHDRRGVENGVL